MGKRPARCYTRIRGPANTRTKKYVRGVPGSKIVRFDMGSPKKEFNAQVSLVAKNRCHIRHSALEAARIGSNRHLQKNITTNNYHLRIRVHPHHVLRENRMMAFAGADRMQNGMRQSFGKPIDKAARVKTGQSLLTVRLDGKNYRYAVGALKRASRKLPTPCEIVVESGHEHIKH